MFGFLFFTHIATIFWMWGNISSALILSTSEEPANNIRLRHFQIIQRAAAQEAANSDRGNFGSKAEWITDFTESMFDGLRADWFHQLQNFLQTLSIQEHLKKQWSKVSTTESQKTQFIEFKVIPRFARLRFVKTSILRFIFSFIKVIFYVLINIYLFYNVKPFYVYFLFHKHIKNMYIVNRVHVKQTHCATNIC